VFQVSGPLSSQEFQTWKPENLEFETDLLVGTGIRTQNLALIRRQNPICNPAL